MLGRLIGSLEQCGGDPQSGEGLVRLAEGMSENQRHSQLSTVTSGAASLA